MIGAIRRAFTTPDLRNKLLFTLGIIVIFRLGSFIPSPGIDYEKVQQCVASPQLNEGGFAMINLFSGGALLQLSIFALGIMPYITASIIVQLLRVVIPRFEALHKEGASGQAKLTQYTRYLTIGLAVLNSTTLVATVESGALFGSVQGCTDLIVNNTWWGLTVIVLTLTAGTGLIMWLGEQITEHGVGNGMSILIFTSIAATFPVAMWSIWQARGFEIFLMVLAVGIGLAFGSGFRLTVVCVVVMTSARLRSSAWTAPRRPARSVAGSAMRSRKARSSLPARCGV